MTCGIEKRVLDNHRQASARHAKETFRGITDRITSSPINHAERMGMLNQMNNMQIEFRDLYYEATRGKALADFVAKAEKCGS